ncbi:MAG: Glyoxylate carboligase [Candidatus Dichloromethanomonas elyunquensis]|nr:MAG: Glyoxylate carboligase [Candidatus Dichloromethanomonas elyunquensis]
MALWGDEKENSTKQEVCYKKITGAQLLVRFLESKGVSQLYGIPGAAVLPVYDAVLDGEKIKSYNVRHEQTAIFMADGYYRATGKMGFCACTSGPGATNFLTGLYCAYADSIPLFAVTGQVPRGLIGKDAFQEAPIVEMARPVTKGAYLIQDVRDLPGILQEAWAKATTGRKGPILLDFPLDVQKSEIEIDLDAWLKEEVPEEKAPEASDQEIENVLTLLKNARMPILLVGGGVKLARASKELFDLAELLRIPVVSSLMGKDSFPNDHPLYAGMIGTICHTPLGNKTLLDSDLVINLGGRFADRTTGDLASFTGSRKFIHVNIDPKELNRQVKTDLAIHADLKFFLQKLCARLRQTASSQLAYPWDIEILGLEKKKYSRQTDFDTSPMKPQRAIAELRNYLKRDAIVTHDCGISQILSSQLFEAYEPGTYLITGRAGNMGWGLGAAMAAKLAYPDRQCVNLVGDGSLGMSLADLATAAKHNIAVVIYLLNNSLLGLIRQQQNMYYNKRWISTDLHYNNNEANHYRGIDFVATAKGMGLGAELVQDPNEIGNALERAFLAQRPYLIELTIDPTAMCSVSGDGTLDGIIENI